MIDGGRIAFGSSSNDSVLLINLHFFTTTTIKGGRIKVGGIVVGCGSAE